MSIDRKDEIIKILEEAKTPISGSKLASKLGVSRQVIVTDIALLRATNKSIISTNKGYVIYKDNNKKKRTFKVSHNDTDIEEELYSIVDLGGSILDVSVSHDIYGLITCDLVINNRSDVDDFIKQFKSTKDNSLKSLTLGHHYHTVEADSEKVLDEIEAKLKELSFCD